MAGVRVLCGSGYGVEWPGQLFYNTLFTRYGGQMNMPVANTPAPAILAAESAFPGLVAGADAAEGT